MNELFNSTDGQAKCDCSIPNKSSCVTNEQSEPNKLKSAPEVPCRRSARISAAKENTTLLNISAYEYLISTSFNKKNRKPRASSTKRKTTKKVINPCDCQDKFSMSSRKLKPFSNFNSNNTSSTDQELDQYQKDEVTANLAHGSNDNKTITDEKDKVEDSDEIFKCIKMKTESKTNNDLKMKIKKCYKKSKKKELNSNLSEVTNDIGVLPKTGVQNETCKKRKRETCRKQFRHKDITLYKLGSGPEKRINPKKQDIQKLFNKFPTNTDGASKDVTVSPLIGEKDMNNLTHSIVKVASNLGENKTNDSKQLETYAEHTKRLRNSAQEETATTIESISIPELRICDELPKVSIQLSELKKDKPETGKHNLPIRIPERRSSIAQPLRSPGFSKKQTSGSTANKTELNFSVDDAVENNVATPTDHNGKCKQADILHRPYQSVENTKSKLSTEGRSLQIASDSVDKKTDEPCIGLLKRCSGITDPLKYKDNHSPPKRGLIKNGNESFIERHTSPSPLKLVVQENQKSPSPTVSNERTYNLTHFTPDSNSNLGSSASTHTASVNVLQSMPLLDVSDERMGGKVSPKLLTPIDTSSSPKNLKRKLSPSEEDKATSTKCFRENSSPSYNFPYSNIPLYNFIPTLSEYSRYLQKYPLHVPSFRAPDLSPPILTPYDSYNTHSAHHSNFPPSSLYNYDYVKSLLNLSKPRLPTNYPPVINSAVNPSEIITKSASPIVTLNVNAQATEIVAEPVPSTAILTIPEVRFTAKKTSSPSAEETKDSEDLNAQTLSKIISKEDLTVTKLSTNFVSTNSSFLDAAKKEDMKINEHTVISDATKHDSNPVPAPEMEILRQELSKPITPTKSLSPQVKCLPKESNQLNKFIEPISPATKTPPPYVISDSETETDNETELEENKNNVALNLTKVKPVVQNGSTKIVPSTSSFEEKRLAHTLNTLTFVVNEIIDKTGSNMPKEDKDMLHKLLKGVRENFIVTSPNSENLSKVSVKQEAVIEIISSDSENSNDSNVDIQKTLDLSTQSSSSTQNVNSQTSVESLTPTNHNNAKSEDVNTDSSLVSNNNGPVNLVSPKSQVHKNASSHLKEEDNCLTNHLEEIVNAVQNEEVCGIDLSLRGKSTKDVPLMTEVNNNEEQQTVQTVIDNPCIDVTKKVTPSSENIKPLQSHPSPVTGVAAETTAAASGSNIDLNTQKLITAAQKTQNNFLNPRPIIARRATYHPSSTTSTTYPNSLYKNTTYHNKSGNIELPTSSRQSSYYKNRNLPIDTPNLTISQPQNSARPSNLSTSLMKTFVCEYLRGGNNEEPVSYQHPASSIPKTSTSHNITQNNVNGKGPHPIDANVHAMQSLQNYTNTAYQAWQDEVRRHRLATVPVQPGTTQFYNKPTNEPRSNACIREARPNLNLNKTNYNMSNPYSKNSQVMQGDSNHPYPANVSEHYYAAYGKRVNINETIQGPKNVSNVPKNQTINKVNGLQYPYGAVKTSTDYRTPCVNYANFGRGGTQPKPYPNHSPPNIRPTKSLPASNQKQIPVYPTHPFPEINSKSSDSFMNKSGRLRETVFNDNASPDYGYYSQQTKTTSTVDGAQYGSYPQNIETRRTSASSQHSSISTLDNPFSEYLQTNSNSSSTTSIASTNNNLENTSQQSFIQILQSKDQAKLANILPKLQTSDQPLTPEQYVREMSILETEGCPKQLLEFYTYVTKKQIASNQRPIGFCIFLEFQNAGKLTVFEDAFKLYTEKRQTEKFVLKDT